MYTIGCMLSPDSLDLTTTQLKSLQVVDLSDLEEQKEEHVDLRLYNSALLELEKDGILFRNLRYILYRNYPAFNVFSLLSFDWSLS